MGDVALLEKYDPEWKRDQFMFIKLIVIIKEATHILIKPIHSSFRTKSVSKNITVKNYYFPDIYRNYSKIIKTMKYQ